MLSFVKSMCLQGLEGVLINVEVDISSGLPYWEIVGLPDTNIRESKDRVKTAIKKVDAAIAANDKEAAGVALRAAISEIGKATSKGIYHKNNSSRKISRLSRAVNRMA